MTGRSSAPSCSESQLLEKNRSDLGIVYSAIPVKSWTANLPSVEAVRPSHCPACGIASRPVGRSLMLHGHGLRPRHLWGPSWPGELPTIEEIQQRRYRCQNCFAVVVVGPPVIWRRGMYTSAAIGGALAGWTLEGKSARMVRAATSPMTQHGSSDADRWRSLARWASGGPFGVKVIANLPRDGPRALATMIARRLVALVTIPTGSISADAFHGAAQGR